MRQSCEGWRRCGHAAQALAGLGHGRRAEATRRRSAPPRAVLAVRAGWRPGFETATAERERGVEVAGEAARACACEGDSASLTRRVRGGDRLVQQLEGVRVHERGEHERELELHVRLLACGRRGLDERPAQVGCRCLWRPPGGGVTRGTAQR